MILYHISPHYNIIILYSHFQLELCKRQLKEANERVKELKDRLETLKESREDIKDDYEKVSKEVECYFKDRLGMAEAHAYG